MAAGHRRSRRNQRQRLSRRNHTVITHVLMNYTPELRPAEIEAPEVISFMNELVHVARRRIKNPPTPTDTFGLGLNFEFKPNTPPFFFLFPPDHQVANLSRRPSAVNTASSCLIAADGCTKLAALWSKVDIGSSAE